MVFSRKVSACLKGQLQVCLYCTQHSKFLSAWYLINWRKFILVISINWINKQFIWIYFVIAMSVLSCVCDVFKSNKEIFLEHLFQNFLKKYNCRVKLQMLNSNIHCYYIHWNNFYYYKYWASLFRIEIVSKHNRLPSSIF